MATIQACMLSGRYRRNALVRHWSQKVSGHCSLHLDCGDKLEDVPHILQHCNAFHLTRLKLLNHTFNFILNLPPKLHDLIAEFCHPSHPKFCHFLLDCSSLPEVITLMSDLGREILQPLFDLTRTWVYVIHRERLKLRGEWKRAT